MSIVVIEQVFSHQTVFLPDIFSDQFIGCYKHKSARQHRQSPDLLSNNTISNCVNYCRSKGYTFAGVEVNFLMI